MYSHGLLFLKFAILLLFERCRGQSDCDGCCGDGNYTEIDEPRRSINSIWEAGQVALCDRDLPWGWYRFTSFVGTEMPTSMVSPNRCGTVAPVWMKGTHPSEQDGTVDRKACINFFNINNGCSQSFDIKVKDCGDFYVYFLRPTYSCAIAYCAGTKEPCPYGKIGKPDDCNDPPIEFDRSLFGEPNITYDPLDSGSASVTLRCEIPLTNASMQLWKNVSYIITWYSEGSHVYTDNICGDLPREALEYDSPCPGKPLFSKLQGENYNANRLLSCNVTARYTTSPLNPWSTPKVILRPFFAGIKVEPHTIELTECNINEIKELTITPTIPVGKSPSSEGLNIGFFLPESLTMDSDQCTQVIDGLGSKTVRLTAVCKSFKSGDADNFIIPKIEGAHSGFWNKAEYLPSIWVSVVDNSENVQRCYTYTDPHYVTFGYHSFTFMGHGDFILYRNAERNFEVHVRQWICSETADTCNCGTVLRDHNDVIEFNCCNENLHFDHTSPIRVKIRSKKRLAPGISITQTLSGFYSLYKVLFPSGVKVEIYRNWFGMNIMIQTPRAKSVSNESGLCLYNNEVPDIDNFGYSFRLEPGESYFDTLPGPINDTGLLYNMPCACHRESTNGEPECLKAPPIHFPNVLDEAGNVVILAGGGGSERKKRDIHFLDNLRDEDFALFKRYAGSGGSRRYKRASVDKPKFTKENATLYCMEKISNTEVGSLCSKLGVNVQAMVNSCSIDLQLTGDTSFAISVVNVLLNECGETAGRNVFSYVNESSGKEPGNTSVVAEIVERLCPGDCSFNGKCVNGSCICNEGFTAHDCAISTEQIPDMFMLQGNGLCDRRQRPCRKVTVFGAGFVNSTNITCHVKEFKVLDGSWTPNNTEVRFPGVMTDLVLVDCYLPESPVTQGYFHDVDAGTPAAGLVIFVSNDGERKSRSNLTFISYDSACISCNVSTGCFLNNNGCIINHYCFAPNEVNPIDWCYQCRPDISNTTWTKRQGNLPPTFPPTINYYAIFEEHLELTIDVLDPEDMPVTVSLMNGSPSNALMRGNILEWNVTNDAVTPFYLQAMDACQAYSTSNITVFLVVCQCQNNGRCVPHPNEQRGSGYYLCDCLPGFTGKTCESNIDECQSYPCFRGDCIDGINNFTCNCYSGYVGRECNENYDDCSTSPCIHGICADYVGAYRCTCEPGYIGENCTIDADDCEPSPCKNGACVDHLNNYTCQCEDGFTGYNCEVDIDECLSSPCLHGTCFDGINSFTCTCKTGFTGISCEDDIDDCLVIPCGNGTCIDLVNNYTCNCHVGFTGPHCDIEIKNCTADSCYPNVTCFKNSETITCGPCPIGLSGDGKNCEDIDYCVNHACNNGGSCVDGISNYSCSCPAGYTDDHCETDIDDCINHTCGNGGTCEDGVNSYFCNCSLGFTGNHCETDIDDCVHHTCSNNGSCEDGVNSYSCNCPEGYTGDHCETDIDHCINHTCQNGASCVDGLYNYSCKCPTGYTGSNCETGLPSPSISAKIVTPKQAVSSSRASTATVVPSTSTTTRISAAARSTMQGIDTSVSHLPSSIKVSTRSSSVVTNIPTPDKEVTPVAVQPTTHQVIASTSVVTDISSSVKESTTVTVQPTTPQTEKKIVVELRIQQPWNKDLENKSSQAFHELSRTLEIQITERYSQEENFVGVEILSFRPGSVVAQFQLLFKNILEDEKALNPLKNAVEDGNLGPLTVDPESLKIIKDVEEPTEESKVPYPLIIGVSCGGIFVLAVVVVYLIRYCHRRKILRHRRESGVMPAEVAFPHPEKYQLQETTSKEDIVRYEETSMWKDPARHEKFAFSNATYQEVGADNQEVRISYDDLHLQEMGIWKKSGEK